MRARLVLPYSALLLLVACGDDVSVTGATAWSASATLDTSTSESGPGSTTSAGASETHDEATSQVTSGTSTSGTSTSSGTESDAGTSEWTTAVDDTTTSDGATDGDTTGDTDGDTDGDTTGDMAPGCDVDPPMDLNAKPSAPAEDAVIAGTSTELEVTLTEAPVAKVTAKFYLREIHELTDADDFTIVVLPDTQNYTQFPGNYPQYKDQTQWIWDHRNTDRIVAVLHNGDIVQHGNIEEIEWKRAEEAMETIEEEVTKFPDGIPYGLAVGNHDNGAFAHDDTPFSTTFFNKYFGVSRFKGRAYYGGHYGKKNDNSWILVRAGNLDVVMVNFEYRGSLGQDPKVLDWAKDVFKAHPHALGVVNSHYIVRADGNFGAQGKAIYNAMKTVDNVQLMTSGHIKHTRARRTDNYNGHKIHSMLADYQDLIIKAEGCAGGCGYMRIWRFSPKKNELAVSTYSPSLKKSMTGPQEQFTLTVDLSAAKGVFEPIGTASGVSKSLAYPLDGLKSGGAYEWYAVVKECGLKATTAKRHFTTKK
ncbi:MAG: metallophosphoesterase [Nannocystaceae bacterium]